MSYQTEQSPERVEHLFVDQRDLETRLAATSPDLAAILERSLAGRAPTVDEATELFALQGDSLAALVGVADELRRRAVGDTVTYVINRNVNWTNVCFVGCKFCSFAHFKNSPQAYDRDVSDVLHRIGEGVALGATEVCMQGGLNPAMPDDGYLQLLRAVREAYPDLHIHAFSPMEIQYGAHRMKMAYRPYLELLLETGLNTMPGTAAEIFDPEIRKILTHDKLDTASWIEIVTTAHEVGLPTTSTMLYGHLETPRHMAEHIEVLRSIQRNTGGLSEFVPLRFIWQNTQLYAEGLVSPVPQGRLDIAVYATSRLMLDGLVDNLQSSWVKLGRELATLSLDAGCNDVGGTLMEESISREAGADSGEYTSAEELRSMIMSRGREPRQRNTLYDLLDESDDGHLAGQPTNHPAGGWSGSLPTP